MSSAIVVDLGSSAVKCGHANSYLTDTQPSVVRVCCTTWCAVWPHNTEWRMHCGPDRVHVHKGDLHYCQQQSGN